MHLIAIVRLHSIWETTAWVIEWTIVEEKLGLKPFESAILLLEPSVGGLLATTIKFVSNLVSKLTSLGMLATRMEGQIYSLEQRYHDLSDRLSTMDSRLEELTQR